VGKAGKTGQCPLYLEKNEKTKENKREKQILKVGKVNREKAYTLFYI
jgi:hypothetical protein